MMTLREVFDKVKTHLLTQGKRAMLPGGYACAYRGAGGTKCAVGCLILDEAYDHRMEGAGMVSVEAVEEYSCWDVRSIWTAGDPRKLADALTASGVPATNQVRNMLVELQDLHDSECLDAFVDWPEMLDQIEARYFPGEVQ